VLNIVTGDGETGKLIVDHPDVDKIAFTGSTDVGRIIRRATAGSGKKLSLELGGKSPFIVYDDADLDSVVEGVVDAIWFNQGQVCCAGSRLLVQEGIADRLTTKLRARMETLRIGQPLDKAIDMGAIVAPVQLDRIRGLVQRGVEEGATMWQPSWACPTEGYFYPPTLFTDVQPSSMIAQVEIFGPVLVTMTFRTPEESVALANNTPFGLAASIWTESINLALDIAPKIKAGVVWINSTNLFDASSGFGGYRESGFGREGGREGMWEYVKPTGLGTGDAALGTGDQNTRGNAHAVWESGHLGRGTSGPNDRVNAAHDGRRPPRVPAINRTPKLFIGGKQTRPDQGHVRRVHAPNGTLIGEVGEGNRKDIRNAVEAAHSAWKGWGKATGHLRGQILFYIGENLAARADEFARRVDAQTGCGDAEASREVDASISRLFTYAAWADKYDGAVHNVPIRGVALAMNEPIGVVGIACPSERPLLGLISLVAPAIAMGNATVVIPSEPHALSATDFYSVLETSDVPAGVVNIVTGAKDALARVLAEHDDVEAVWYFGAAAGVKMVEEASAVNMKRTWATWQRRDWLDARHGEGREFLREATQVKNIWVPYGE
jgi:aldehyde dehydrogenase (NAD+)